MLSLLYTSHLEKVTYSSKTCSHTTQERYATSVVITSPKFEQLHVGTVDGRRLMCIARGGP